MNQIQINVLYLFIVTLDRYTFLLTAFFCRYKNIINNYIIYIEGWKYQSYETLLLFKLVTSYKLFCKF